MMGVMSNMFTWHIPGINGNLDLLINFSEIYYELSTILSRLSHVVSMIVMFFRVLLLL